MGECIQEGMAGWEIKNIEYAGKSHAELLKVIYVLKCKLEISNNLFDIPLREREKIIELTEQLIDKRFGNNA